MYDWQTMKESYRATRSFWEAKRTELKKIKDQRIAAEVYNNELDDDITLIGGIISDLTYAIEWINTGRRPGNTRGIDRRSVYQRTQLWDKAMIENYSKGYESRSATTVTDEQREQIKDALRALSPLERECFLLVEGRGFSSGQAAEFLNVTKGTVDRVLNRARGKFKAGWQMTLC